MCIRDSDNPTSEENTSHSSGPVTAYDPATSSLVTFTVDDQTWLNEDIRIKGSMSGWNTFQAYDDGTNGDATAGDYIWTAQYAVITDGDYEWGAIDTDNADGTSCEACDGTDGWGTWLISGPNQQFSVSGADVSGTVDYMIPPDMAVSEGVVMFTVHDETEEWTDIMWKGSPTSWAVQQMYDDGTNGDEEAGDHIWTAQVAGVTAFTDVTATFTGLGLTMNLNNANALIWNEVPTGNAPIDPPGWRLSLIHISEPTRPY